MAQSRALNQRFQLFLPPPEDPAAIHSSLTQVIEALAADMIEPSRARALISGLRLCLQSLKKKGSWHDSAYHCDQPVDYENFEAEYGLPKDVDLNAAPEVAFPPAPEDPAATLEIEPQLPPVPPDIAAEAQHIINFSRGLPLSAGDSKRFGSYVTPLDAEMMEVTRTQGFDAALKIQEQFEHNEQRRVRRRQSSADRERYALVSMQRNLQAAIEKHAARLTAESSRLAGVSGAGASWRVPERGAERPVGGPAAGGVGRSMPAPKKPSSAAAETLGEINENAHLTPTGSIG